MFRRALKRVFGPRTALEIYVYVQRFFSTAVIVFACGSMGALLYWMSARDAGLAHERFVLAKVLGVVPLNSENRFGIIVDLSLPDGTPLRLVTTDGAVAGSIVETACVEERRAEADGGSRYFLRHATKCEA